MVLVTGAWAPNSTSSQRMRLELDYSISSTSTTSTVTGTVYVAAGYSFVDVNNSFSYSGSLLGSGSANNRNINVPTGGRQAIYTFTKTVARTSAAQGMTVGFQLSGIEYVGYTASLSTTVSIPGTGSGGTTPPPPGEATTVTISRSDLTSIRVEFTGPLVQKIEARRRTVMGDSSSAWRGWELIGTSTGYASGTTFPAVVGYDWQVRVTRGTSDSYTSNALRHYSSGPALTSANVTHYTNSRHNVDWVATASAEHPITGFEIQRWTTSSGTYAGAASWLGAATRTWSDTANLFNERARWAIRAHNSAGAGPWTYTPYVRTAPAAPSRPDVARSGSTDIVISTINHARAAQTFTVWGSSFDGTAWTAMEALEGYTALPAPAHQATWQRILSGLDPARQWRFAVSANVNEPKELSNRSATSAALQLLAPPTAPVVKAMGTQSSAAPTVVEWAHNPIDGSGQTAAELRYAPADSTSWTTLTAATAQSLTIATLAAGSYQVQVRTKGAHADFSPWSALMNFSVAAPPVVLILSPAGGAEIASNRLALDIAYSDAQGAAMTGWTRRLWFDGQLVEESSGTGRLTRVTFDTQLEDRVSYRAEVVVSSGTGLQSTPARIDISTRFREPLPPVVNAVWDEATGMVHLSLSHVAPTPAIPGLMIPGTIVPGAGIGDVDYDVAEEARIERSMDGGATWEVLAEGMGPNPAVDDWSARLNIPALYRGVSITALGVEAASLHVEVWTGSQDVWLRGADGQMARVRLTLELEPRFGHASISEDYGRAKPVAHFGRQRPVEVGVSGELVAGYGLERDWKVFLGQHVWYRDPTGNAFWARITEQGFGLPQRYAQLAGISFQVEEVEAPRVAA